MKELARNKRAYFDYQILEEIEAGIELLGFETKATKSGKINLAGSYARIINNQVWLVGADIAPYQPNNTPKDYDPERTRRLLVTSKEVGYLTGKMNEAGLTVVPLRAYIKGRLVKVSLGLVRSKKKQDKRETIKKRDIDKEIRRSLKLKI
ncbi:MAG: SsrA-binding protein [Candidatus Colwellbacteria bacterium CG10_big_fil_rev_8_21_14_0_10_42_22]|uniref:SsrA-binding protein n=1 Tax=Candidatus Colwellbacteria bacterium CG10_big_fil_rev_8_21_14_0_10_42_22 TaxID=1974540 RepID=A0A2H0VHU4_9BACT|nr:MAG: SsrA-binding protein [Candidatus Colwellbacteria bacterium CG10_big_fil_rev_8_21_14_0_10_42_22]